MRAWFKGDKNQPERVPSGQKENELGNKINNTLLQA